MDWTVHISTDPEYWGTTDQLNDKAVTTRAAEILADWISGVFAGEGVVASVGTGPWVLPSLGLEEAIRRFESDRYVAALEQARTELGRHTQRGDVI